MSLSHISTSGKAERLISIFGKELQLFEHNKYAHKHIFM